MRAPPSSRRPAICPPALPHIAVACKRRRPVYFLVMTPTQAPVPDAFSVDVERLTYGPDALAHYQRCVVFVPFAAPGDRAEVHVEERHRGYVRARPTRLVTPGPSRVAPFCPVFGSCGGCQWQHVAPDAQRAAKRAVVTEQLARLGGLRDVDVRPMEASGDRAYRTRITLAVQDRTLGYRQGRSHALVPVSACPIAADPVSAAIAPAAECPAGEGPPMESRRIAAAPDGVVLVAALAGAPDDGTRARAEAWLGRTRGVQGIVLRARGARLVLGDPSVHVPLEPDLRLEVPADVFTQVNPALNPLLVTTRYAEAGVRPGSRAFDLYCGAGNFALPLARRGAEVLAVESAAIAVDAGRANAARTGLTGVEFRCG